MTLRSASRSAALLFIAALAGAVASLGLAAPASADEVDDPRVINDGEITCLVNGHYAVPWHVGNPNMFDIELTSVQESPEGSQADFPDGNVVPAGDSLFVRQFAPPGTRIASLSFEWEKVGDPNVNGSFSGETSQTFPACAPQVSADFTPNCGKLFSGELVNSSNQPQTFVIGDATHEVAAGATKQVDSVPADADGELAVYVRHAIMQVDLLVEVFTWREPRTCSPPQSTTPPVLSQTGTPVGGLLGLGVGLVVAGIALVTVIGILRRRRDRAAAS